MRAGYGVRPTARTNSTLVDAIVWVKPPGESDGECGPEIEGEKAPGAGRWWDGYAQQAVLLADPPVEPSWW